MGSPPSLRSAESAFYEPLPRRNYELGTSAGSNGADAACVGSCGCAGVVDEDDDDPLCTELSGAPEDDALAPLVGTGPPEGSNADPVTSRTAHFPCTYLNLI